ncbi:MAG TPA: ABC transporter substrate-binding protein [Terriglobales bacterium]|nr:ABC transporter substrate-binding protein [Terriglobales bacterium]
MIQLRLNRCATIEYRWAENQYDRLPELAADLVRREVAVIAATGGAPSALAAKAATSTIPIVFTAGSDPVRAGLVPSLNRPGGNVTGVSFLTDALAAKRLGLLREIVREPGTIAVLINPQGPDAAGQLKDIRSASEASRQPINIVMASTKAEIDAAFANITQSRAKALIVGADPFFNDSRHQIIALAAHFSLPAIYEVRDFVLAGGLMSRANIVDAYRQAGIYTGRILKGERPAELPVMQAVKFEFLINLKTAKALGVEVHPQLLATADEVIE